MLDAALDAHVVMNASGQITEWNAQAEAMFGWTREEIVGQFLVETIIPPAYREAHRSGLAHFLRTGQGAILGRRLEVEALRRNGVSFPIELTVASVGTPEGPAFSAFLRDLTERRQVDQQLRQLALHDALTGLPNRILLHDRAEQAFAAARRANGTVALLLVDLDGFKDVNDAHGHAVGDLVLQEVARRLRAVARESDTVARLGGDEFVLLLSDGDVESVGRVGRALREAFARPIAIEGGAVSIAASAGVAFFPRHGADAPTLLRAADIAMYAAKRRRFGIALYEEGSDPRPLPPTS
jgi:diguanylate cyclase (GGDEF)-like protein/PAS domain S-box-containing protein